MRGRGLREMAWVWWVSATAFAVWLWTRVADIPGGGNCTIPSLPRQAPPTPCFVGLGHPYTIQGLIVFFVGIVGAVIVAAEGRRRARGRDAQAARAPRRGEAPTDY
jgi:hypothetical protein